jgi:hypothetical protein
MFMRLKRKSDNKNANHCISSHQSEETTTWMRAVITLWVSLTKYQTSTFIMNGSEELPLFPMTSSVADSRCRSVNDNLLRIEANNYTKVCILSFFLEANRKTQSWCQLALKGHGSQHELSQLETNLEFWFLRSMLCKQSINSWQLFLQRHNKVLLFNLQTSIQPRKM